MEREYANHENANHEENEVVGHIHPVTAERVAQVRHEEKLAEPTRARLIAEALGRTDRRGLRHLWRRRVIG